MHFYRERMNIRQICDWCRLMWKYSDNINADYLYKHINKSGLIKEWETFSALAVNYLGMLADRIPYYNTKQSSKKRSEYLAEFILNGYSGSIIKDTYHIAKIFPKKTIVFSPSIFLNVNWLKIKERIKGL